MIVQIANTNTKAVVSGHFFKDDCPDRVDYAVNNTVKFFEDANFPDENAVYTLDNVTNKSIFNVKLC